MEKLLKIQVENYKIINGKYESMCKEKNEKMEPNLKIIKLDLKSESFSLKDKFEWDINDSKNNPEGFA